MASIGKLTYDIEADTAKFEKGIVATRKELRQVQKVMRETENPAERLGREIAELSAAYKKGLIPAERYQRQIGLLKEKAQTAQSPMAGLGRDIRMAAGAMLTVGAARTFFDELDRIDEIAKTSRKLGIATDDLIGLQHAAEQTAGVTGGQLNMALQRMTRRVSEAAIGMGEAKGALAELGLEAEVLNNSGPGEAFRQIADAMADVQSEQDQLRLAFKLFDSEGAALVNTLSAGREELDAFRDSAKDLGLTFTDQQAAEVEAANDSLDRMMKSFRGMKREYAVDAAPSLENSFGMIEKTLSTIRDIDLGGAVSGPREMLRRMADDYNAVIDSFFVPIERADDATEGLAETTRGLFNESAKVSDVYASYAADLRRAGQEAKQARIDDGSDAIANETRRLKERNLELKMGADWVRQYNLMQDATPDQIARFNAADAEHKRLTEAAEAAREDQERAMAAQAEMERQHEEMERQAARIAEKVRTPFDSLVKDLADVKVLVDLGLIDEATAQRQVAESRDAFVKDRGEKPIRVEFPPNAQQGTREEFQLIKEISAGNRQAEAKRDQQEKLKAELLTAIKEATKQSAERLEEIEPAEGV